MIVDFGTFTGNAIKKNTIQTAKRSMTRKMLPTLVIMTPSMRDDTAEANSEKTEETIHKELHHWHMARGEITSQTESQLDCWKI